MNILLIKPRYSFNSRHPVQFDGAEKALPLSLAYLAAAFEQRGWTVRVVDYQVDTLPIADAMREFSPDLVGVTAFSKEMPHALALMAEIKSLTPDMPIMLGGPHVNAYKERTLRQAPHADYLIVHEGEETAVELAECLAASRSPADVAGLVLRGADGEGRWTGARPFIQDLDALPFMALHYFKVGRYHPTAGTFRRLPSVTMITARGCPYPCTFCNTDLFGRNVRLRSAENVLDEIEEVVRRHGAREINFVDETLTINRGRIEAICEGLIRRNIKIGWKCSTRVDRVDQDLLRLMKKSGCFYVGYGVESGVQATLDRLKKGITLEQTRAAFKYAREAGITTMAYFMMNVPGETREDIEQSIRFSREIKTDFLNFELIKPYGGTKIRKAIEESPDIKINHDLWEEWEAYSAGNHLFYVQDGLDEDYLADAYKRAVKNFYLRPSFILKAALQLRSFAQLRIYFRYFLNMLRVGMVKGRQHGTTP